MNFKKIFATLFVLGAIIFPALTLAAENGCRINADRLEMFRGEGLMCPINVNICQYSTTDVNNDCGTCCLLNTVYNVVDWTFLIIIAIAVIMIIWGAFDYLTSGGDTTKLGNANKRILFAAIGIVVALLAKAVPSIVLSIVR